MRANLSRPGRALARRADGNASLYGARTRDCVLSQLERTTRRANTNESYAAARSNRQTSRRINLRVGLAEFPVYDPQTGVARDPWVTEAAMCVRLVDVRITCGLHDDAQIAAVFIDPRAK